MRRLLFPLLLVMMCAAIPACLERRAISAHEIEGTYRWESRLECTYAEIDIDALSADRVEITGAATWCSSNEVAEIGGVNGGLLDVEAQVFGDKILYIDHDRRGSKDEPHMIVIMQLDENLLLLEKNGGHGLNVSFTGLYTRQ